MQMKPILLFALLGVSFCTFAQSRKSNTILFNDLKRLTSFLNYSVGPGGMRDNIQLNQKAIIEAGLLSEFSVQKWAGGFHDWRSLKKNLDEKLIGSDNSFLNAYRAYIMSTQPVFLNDFTTEATGLKIKLLNDLLENSGKSFHVYYALLTSIKVKATSKEFKECLTKVLVVGAKTMENKEQEVTKKFIPIDPNPEFYGVAEGVERIRFYYNLIKKL